MTQQSLHLASSLKVPRGGGDLGRQAGRGGPARVRFGRIVIPGEWATGHNWANPEVKVWGRLSGLSDRALAWLSGPAWERDQGWGIKLYREGAYTWNPDAVGVAWVDSIETPGKDRLMITFRFYRQ